MDGTCFFLFVYSFKKFMYVFINLINRKSSQVGWILMFFLFHRKMSVMYWTLFNWKKEQIMDWTFIHLFNRKIFNNWLNIYLFNIYFENANTVEHN